MTISAKVICDSISEFDKRITTLQLRYPRFIHSEFMTHRVFSRNASSSRAIPVGRLIQDIIDDTAMPIHWGKNFPGMQANEECNNLIIPPYTVLENDRITSKEAWELARNQAIYYARAFANAGFHKQIVNRLLEPFSHINVVVTATEWSNFLALRNHKDAQPEIRMLAMMIEQALLENRPQVLNKDQWHLPYVSLNNQTLETFVPIETLIKCSVARCARVSYLTHEFKQPSLEDDLKLYERLLGSNPIHASPAEHQARPDKLYSSEPDGKLAWGIPELHGNFKGWIQYRKTLPNECL